VLGWASMGNARWAAVVGALAAIAVAAVLLQSGPTEPEPAGPDAGPADVAVAQPTLAAAPTPAAPAATAPPPAANPRAARVVGRVVAEKSAPVAGATVTLGPEPEAADRATTDADGRFAIAVKRPATDQPPALLVARDDASHVGTAVVYWRRPSSWAHGLTDPRGDPAHIDVGDVLLRETSGLEVAVTDPRGSAAGGARVFATTTWSMSETPLRSATADAKGRARLEGLPAGPVTVYAWIEGVGRGAVDALVPRTTDGPAEIALSPLRDVEVSVVEKATKAPIPGAVVWMTEWIGSRMSTRSAPYLPALRILPTDARGKTRLSAIAQGARGRVGAKAAGFGAAGDGRGDDGAGLSSDATTLVIGLERLRRVSWAVEAGEVPAPPDGTVLLLKPSVGGGTAISGTARMEGGRVVAEGVEPGYVGAIAQAPDGSQARLWAAPGQDEGAAARFVRSRTARISLRFSDGAPATGVWVSLKNQGNNPFGPAVQTDSGGRVVLEGLEAQMADVYLSETPQWYGGRRIATCDLAKGDGTVAVVVPRARSAVVRVFLDGTPGLPRAITPAFGVMGAAILVDRDEAASALRVRFTPLAEGADTALSFDAPGWLVEKSVRIPAAAGDAPAEARLDLRKAGALDVQVVAPKDDRFRLRLERFDSDTSTWVATWFDTQSFGSGQAQIDAEGRWRLETLPPGKYRVREVSSSAVSEEIVVVAGATAGVRFDVSASGFVTGRILVPAGESPEGVTVQIDPPPPAHWSGDAGSARADKEGKFKIRVPGAGDVVLTAKSLFLVPSATGGSARVAAGATDVVLVLAKSPVGIVTFDREPKYRMNPGQKHSDTVSMWRGPMRGAPATTTKALVDGKTARFGSFAPGRWTVVIDIPVCAPVVLRDVELGAGETDLGTVALSEGTSLMFEVKFPEGQSAPRIQVTADRLDPPPAYQRWGEIGDGGRLPGLGAGRFRVTAHPTMGGALLLDREIEVDGTAEFPIVIEVK
jgi:hypothetical protein